MAERVCRYYRIPWGLDPRERAQLPEWIEHHSAVVRDDAYARGIPFFDLSDDFEQASAEALRRLMETEH